MPFLAAAGAAIASAASAVTLTGLAVGASIVGTGLQAIGMITKSKTLAKVGMGMSMAGGFGQAGTSLSKMGKMGVSGGNARSSSLLNADNIDDALGAQTRGSKTASDLIQFKKPGYIAGASSSSIDSFNRAANDVGSGFDPTKSNSMGSIFDPGLEKGYIQRANDTLTKYSPMMGMLGGAGEAYMLNERMDLNRELQDKQLAFDQQTLDRVKANNDVPLGMNALPTLERNTNAYAPLLRR